MVCLIIQMHIMLIFVVLKFFFNRFSFHFVFTSVEILFCIEYKLIIMGSLIKIARAFGARIIESYLKMLASVFDGMMLTNYCSGLLRIKYQFKS